MACHTGKLEVKVKDPRITFNLVEGEELLTCPYDPSHGVLQSKFQKHVNNCHAHHCEAQRKKGLESKFQVCQFDRSHHYPKDHIKYHEEHCPSRVNVEIEVGCGSGSDDDAASVASSVHSQRAQQPYSPQTLEAVHEEDWGTEPSYEGKFDLDQAVQELRSQGYIYIKTDPLVGLTKTQKKEFYAKEAADIKSYTKKAGPRTQISQRRNERFVPAPPPTPRVSQSSVTYRFNARTLRTTKDQRLAILRERLRRPAVGLQAQASVEATNFRYEEEEEEDPFSPRYY